MLGAIIGDIVGSIYERYQIKTKDFPLFGKNNRITDDTVCTVAVADILLNDIPPAITMQKWCQRYPNAGYGGNFGKWIYRDSPLPDNSFGNGSAMRVSPAAFLNQNNLENALIASDKVTEITHNHSEGMKGARATTHAIWLAFQNEKPDAIRDIICREYDYDLSKSVDEIRPDYSFDVTCQGSVPQAITCALESRSFEDAIRNAVSLGGDSDTLAAIAGPIAEGLYGIPNEIVTLVKNDYLEEEKEIIDVLNEMYKAIEESNG